MWPYGSIKEKYHLKTKKIFNSGVDDSSRRYDIWWARHTNRDILISGTGLLFMLKNMGVFTESRNTA